MCGTKTIKKGRGVGSERERERGGGGREISRQTETERQRERDRERDREDGERVARERYTRRHKKSAVPQRTLTACKL